MLGFYEFGFYMNILQNVFNSLNSYFKETGMIELINDKEYMIELLDDTMFDLKNMYEDDNNITVDDLVTKYFKNIQDLNDKKYVDTGYGVLEEDSNVKSNIAYMTSKKNVAEALVDCGIAVSDLLNYYKNYNEMYIRNKYIERDFDDFIDPYKSFIRKRENIYNEINDEIYKYGDKSCYNNRSYLAKIFHKALNDLVLAYKSNNYIDLDDMIKNYERGMYHWRLEKLHSDNEETRAKATANLNSEKYKKMVFDYLSNSYLNNGEGAKALIEDYNNYKNRIKENSKMIDDSFNKLYGTGDGFDNEYDTVHMKSLYECEDAFNSQDNEEQSDLYDPNFINNDNNITENEAFDDPFADKSDELDFGDKDDEPEDKGFNFDEDDEPEDKGFSIDKVDCPDFDGDDSYDKAPTFDVFLNSFADDNNITENSFDFGDVPKDDEDEAPKVKTVSGNIFEELFGTQKSSNNTAKDKMNFDSTMESIFGEVFKKMQLHTNIIDCFICGDKSDLDDEIRVREVVRELKAFLHDSINILNKYDNEFTGSDFASCDFSLDLDHVDKTSGTHGDFGTDYDFYNTAIDTDYEAEVLDINSMDNDTEANSAVNIKKAYILDSGDSFYDDLVLDMVNITDRDKLSHYLVGMTTKYEFLTIAQCAEILINLAFSNQLNEEAIDSCMSTVNNFTGNSKVVIKLLDLVKEVMKQF